MLLDADASAAGGPDPLVEPPPKGSSSSRKADSAAELEGVLSHASTTSAEASSDAVEIGAVRSHSSTTNGSWNSKEPGRDFNADYEVGSKVLGQGVSGTVHEATCRRTGKTVAVKSFKKWGMTPRALENVKRECAVHSSVNHQNILKVEDVYQEANAAVHIVTERLEGGELFERVLAKQGLDEGTAARVAVQLLRAVGFLHARRITHRDIKPENIMFKEEQSDVIKLIDFGFATYWEEDQRLKQRCGTLQYAAPEVLSEAGYTWKADMWSLGGVVYTTLVARLLYAGSNSDVARKNKEGKVDFSKNFSKVSWLAQDFVKSLLVVNERRRPSAFDALLHPWLRRHAPIEAEEARAEIVAEVKEQERLRLLAQEALPASPVSESGKEAPERMTSCFAALATWSCCAGAVGMIALPRDPNRTLRKQKSAYMHRSEASALTPKSVTSSSASPRATATPAFM